MKICRLCKHLNAAENNYCEKCNLSFKDGAVRKTYYNERETPLTKIKKNEHRKVTTKGSKKSSFLNVVGICILLVVSIGSYFYFNKDASTYNEAVELWNAGEIKAAMDVAKEVPESSRKYNEAQKLVNNGEDYLLYSEAVELWNNGDITEAIKVAKEVSESSNQYKDAQKLINNGEDYLLYSRAVYLWNVHDYEEAVKILKSFTEESEYYLQAQDALNNM